MKYDIDLYNNRSYTNQYVPVPQRFEHFAMLEGVLLRNMIEHLDYDEIIENYSYIFHQSYVDVYLELNQNIPPFKTENVINFIGLSEHLHIFKQENFNKLMADTNDPESAKKIEKQQDHGEVYINGSLIVQYIRDIGRERRQQYG